MLTQPVFEQLKELRCHGMLEALREQQASPNSQQLSFDERFALLIERECMTRENTRLTNRLRLAKLKINVACLEDIDYQAARGLSKTTIQHLADCQWIARKQNILITGPTGTGKTYLACAFANQACRQTYSARYVRLLTFFRSLEIARGDGSYPRLMALLAKTQLLILDDWGLTTMTEASRRDLLEIMDDRYNQSSTIITSQLPVNLWHDSIGEATLGDAILDRIIHNSHRIELQGDESMRKKKAKNILDESVLLEPKATGG